MKLGTRVGVVVLAACGVLAAGVAVATAGPPLTKGYATFSAGSVTTRCSSGVPAHVRFAFDWNATKLSGEYHVQAVLTVTRRSDGKVVLTKTAPATITAGATGSYAHRFALPAGARGKDATLTLSTTQGSAYDYVRTSHVIRCADPSYAPQLPKIVAGRVTCNGQLAIVFDNTTGSQTWGFVYKFQPGNTSPGSVPIKPGEVVHSFITHLTDNSPPWLLVRMHTGSGPDRSAGVLAAAFRTKLPSHC